MMTVQFAGTQWQLQESYLVVISFTSMYTFIAAYYYHHQVPSTSSRSAIMDLQLFLSSTRLTHPLQVCSNHSLMFFIQVILGLPRPLFPLPSSNNFWIDLALITCPKTWHFLFFIVGNNELFVFAFFKTSSLVLCFVLDTLNILLYTHISKASNLLSMVLVRVHVSKPYNIVDHII